MTMLTVIKYENWLYYSIILRNYSPLITVSGRNIFLTTREIDRRGLNQQPAWMWALLSLVKLDNLQTVFFRVSFQ